MKTVSFEIQVSRLVAPVTKAGNLYFRAVLNRIQDHSDRENSARSVPETSWKTVRFAMRYAMTLPLLRLSRSSDGAPARLC